VKWSGSGYFSYVKRSDTGTSAQYIGSKEDCFIQDNLIIC